MTARYPEGQASAMIWMLMGCLRGGDTGVTCEDSGPQVGQIDATCRCETPWIEIGTGDDAFEALAPSGLEMVFGSQGGWHLTAAARVGNTRDVVDLTTTVTMVDSGVEVTGGNDFYTQLVPESGCTHWVAGRSLLLYPELSALGAFAPEAMACQDARLDFCVSDSTGNAACASETVRVLPDPDDVARGRVEACD